MKHHMNWFNAHVLLVCLLMNFYAIPSEEPSVPVTSAEGAELPAEPELSEAEKAKKKKEEEDKLREELGIGISEIPESTDKYQVDFLKTVKQLYDVKTQKGGKLSWSDFVVPLLSTFEMSADQIKVFDGLEMRNVSIGKVPKGFSRGTTFEGTVDFRGIQVEAKLVVVDPTSETFGEQWARQKVETEDALEKNAVEARAKENEVKKTQKAVAENEYLGVKELFDEEKNKKPTPMAQEPGTPKVGVSFSLGIPKQTKITQIFGNQMSDSLKKQLNDITMPAGKIIVSNFFYSQASENMFFTETPDQAKKPGMEKPEFEREYNRLEVIPIRKGVNFVAEVGLAGPFRLFDEFVKEKAKSHLDAMIIKAGDVVLRGVISPNMIGSQFGVSVPIQIGVDLTKISKVPKSVTEVIQALSTEGFYVVLSPVKLEMLAGAAIRLKLGTQKEPFIWNMQGAISPQEITPAVFTDSTIQVTEWCALSNFGLSLSFNWELLPVALAMGIPFTGIGLRGAIRIGREGHMEPKKDAQGNVITDAQGKPIMVPTEHPIVCRMMEDNALDTEANESGKTEAGDTIVCVAAGAKVQANSTFGELVFEGVAKNIDLTHMAQFFIQLAINQKKKTVGDISKMPFIDAMLKDIFQMPAVNFKQMRIYIVPVDTMLAGKEYKAGIAVDSDVQWGEFDGGIHGQFYLENNAIKGVAMNGHMKPIERDWIKIKGVGTSDVYGENKEKIGGPVLAINFNEMEFGVKAQVNLELPKLNVSQKVNFMIGGESGQTTSQQGVTKSQFSGKMPNKLYGDFETKIGNLFTSKFKVALDMMDLGELQIGFRFEQDFANIIENAVKDLQKVALDKINQISAQASQVQGSLDALKQQLASPYNKEINDINQQISTIERQLSDLRRECDKYPAIAKPFQTACIGIPIKETERAAKIAYRDGLLKPGQKVVQGATDQITTLTNTVAQLRTQQQAVQKVLDLLSGAVTDFSRGITTIDIRKAEGSITGKDLTAGKLPILKELEIVLNFAGTPPRTIRLENLQFDFQHPQESGSAIASQVRTQIEAIPEFRALQTIISGDIKSSTDTLYDPAKAAKAEAESRKTDTRFDPTKMGK